MDSDVFLSTEQLAQLRGVPPSRLDKERLTGGGPPFIKDGHLVRYNVGDYRKWAASLKRYTTTAEWEADAAQVVI